ncbi:hypothetical protein Asp14428_76300 [Actinoplanes sp. NBRC 14428]|uniref:Uncharacterized protein n=1 Tax=Pseudosporangium ferrugineum TaxID=439699 RepID=A0A2T0RX80_9ACTN|nr:permease prefix domain 1-containing protein [Pseudosporangium ferrugineum]PRY25795.1 hypothetical protein CLV70_112161 [Pseudosporangium ferrugineum]BCJ56155.1 hypothetical protein Asp14428_76300 [Actinoplanes sp. NBRC 14428]
MKASGRPAEEFLAEFSAHLDGRGAWRRRVEAEMRDGLSCAISDVQTEDLDADEAERRVLRDWGSPRELAEQFNGIGSVANAGRLAGRILIATPVLAVAWALVVLLSRDPWPTEPTFIFIATRLLGASVTIAVVCSAAILIDRRRAVLRGRAPSWAAVWACAGTAAANLVLIAMLIYRAGSGPSAISWALAALPGLLTPTLLGLTLRDVRRIRAARVPRQ